MNSREVKVPNKIRIAKLWSNHKLLPLKWDGIKQPKTRRLLVKMLIPPLISLWVTSRVDTVRYHTQAV